MGLPMKCQYIFKAPFCKKNIPKPLMIAITHTYSVGSPTDYRDSCSGQDAQTRVVSKKNKLENVSFTLVSRN